MKYKLIQKQENHNLTVVEQVLFNRGIKPQDIEHYLNTTDNDFISENKIKNIQTGVELLARHIVKGSKIFLQVDCDADGFCSSAILINYLWKLFPRFCKNNIIYRIHNGKEHGVIVDTVPEDVSLVIIPDAGSNQYEEHKMLQDKGMDILVIDHHEAEKESPYACIINNQLCDYPTKSLCGGAMVYKFCKAFDKFMGENFADDFYDLVALALISDMMDIRDFETKHFINKGLAHITNPFFSAMVARQEYSLRDGLSPIGIAFYITPYINATIRVGSQKEKTIMFESMLDMYVNEEIPSTKRGCRGQTETRVAQATRACMTIKKHQGAARDKEAARISEIIKEENLLNNKILAVRLPGEEVNKNLVGLIANELMSEYQKPTLLLSYKDGAWSGSARNFDKSDFKNFKDFCANSKLVEYAEGHQGAFGISIAEENFDDFINYANTKLAQYDFSPNYQVDFIFDGNNFNGKDILEIAELKDLWGQNMNEPLIAIEDIKITKNNVSLMSADKNPTLKITLSNGTSLIKFKSSKEEYEKLISSPGCLVINTVGTCNSNAWNGGYYPQVMIKDYDIVGELKYYF